MEPNDSTLAHRYQHKTDIEHVLSNPDTYTGSMVASDWDAYVLDRTESGPMVHRKVIRTVPGLIKLVDEALVNARDHQVRMAAGVAACKGVRPVTTIEASFDTEGVISVMNDGNGLDVAKHPELGIWIPEMVFGKLRTSTNYDKADKKIVGGKNGFGFKLVLIWSEWGQIETVDHIRGLKYTQSFGKNLSSTAEPTVVKCRTKPYTRVTFKPDYARLGLAGLSPDMLALMHRRVYEIAAITDKSVRVKLDGELVPVRHFRQYIGLYPGTPGRGAGQPYESPNSRWEYAVALTPYDEFAQVSFVNGIATPKGGKHVEYIINQIVRKVAALIKKRKKVDVRPATVKEQLMLFLRCDIENPGFDSQTKEYLTTQSSTFGSSCQVSDAFAEKVAKMGVMEAACAMTEIKDTRAAKKSDGAKTKSVRGIPKLVDANLAGTARSGECTLILCEGDSAKAGIVSGLAKEDRDTIGIYPMRGKLFNVRGEMAKRVQENKEITELKKILGLENGKEYTAESAREKLRYSKVLFMTDQDLDGSHIKGLAINLFDAQWRSLAELPGFLGFMNTPILKARKGAQQLCFYNDGEWEAWRTANDTRGWTIKYYKGLGTSTSKEFKEYFAHQKVVRFESSGAPCRDAIDKAFNKKRSGDRKVWLGGYDRTSFLDTGRAAVSYVEFVHQEMIHFSKYDCDRSIPNLMDGLKTSQRKILYTAFKRKLTKDIKVAQFSGSVSEMSCYHHGEASLNGAIKGMAQTYVGSNNVNLLEPKGQFGTRLQGGDDAASERYISTCLTSIARRIFPEADDEILDYLDDDGVPVEPVFYAPVLPLLLVNGAKGIGTGFSTEVLPYAPLDLIARVRAALEGGDDVPIAPLVPYFEGFEGTVKPLAAGKYLVRGKHEILSNKLVRVTELPVGLWTDDFKQHLEALIEGGHQRAGTGRKKASPQVKDYRDMSTDTHVDFTITMHPGVIEKLSVAEAEHGCTQLEKLLKLYTTRSTSNMHMFDEEERLVKCASPEEVIERYMVVRMECYSTRKKHMIGRLTQECLLATNKARFILAVLSDKIDLRRKKAAAVEALLAQAGFDRVSGAFAYLTRMPMDSVTEENVARLKREKARHEAALAELQATTPAAMWINELSDLEDAYRAFRKTRCLMQSPPQQATGPKKVKKRGRKARAK